MQHGTITPRARGIDGLRALCIVAIIIYHLNPPWLPSGHMGVVIFLVMSGYFATNGITRILDANGSVRIADLGRAWGKRLARIVPSVFALVAIVGVLCATLSHVLFTKMRPDIIPSLGFFLNWSYIIRDISYFDLIGGTSPLLHLWYIGVDLQFFFAWTLLLFIMLKIGKPVARWCSFTLAIASAVWMAILYVPGTDPSRVYYGTDTRAFALLLGSWLALVLPLGRLPEVRLGRLFVKTVDEPTGDDTAQLKSTVFSHLVGLVACAGLVAAMILLPAEHVIWYRGGMFAFAFVATILVATLLAPRNLLGMLLGLAPFRVLGARAFALYLWHYPIFLLMDANKSTTVWWMRLAAVGVSLVAAEVSLRLVERPFGPSYKRVFKKKDADAASASSSRPKVLMALTSIAVVAAGVYTYHAYTTLPDESLVPEEMLVSTGSSAGQAMDLTDNNEQRPSQGEQSNPDGTGSQQGDQIEATVEVTENTIVYAPADEVNAGKRDPILIGDSVPGDAGNEFVVDNGGWEGRLPDGHFDSFIGRRPDQALEVLRGYLDQDVVGKIVVLACFSNSTPYPETLDEMIEAAGPEREIYLVGTVNPDGFQDAANENLQEAAERYENVHYVDWPAVLEGHLEEYLWADATHLRPEGARVYVDMVVRAIAQDMVDAGGSAAEG